MRAVRSRCASLVGVGLVLRALGDSIVMRRVWGGYTPRWMGHDRCEGRVDQVRVDDGEEKLAVQRFTRSLRRYFGLSVAWVARFVRSVYITSITCPRLRPG